MKYTIGNIKLEFSETSGGFPAVLVLNSRGKTKQIIETDAAWLSCTLADGSKVRPFMPEDIEVFRSKFKTAERIEFRKIPWRDQNGQVLEDFYLALRYEIWPDGTCFVNTFFFVENTNAPDIVDFKMELALNLNRGESPRWGCMTRPRKFDGTMIQSAKPLRFQAPLVKTMHEAGIIPQFSFDSAAGREEAMHLEFFMEGQNSLSGNPEETNTELLWQDGKTIIRWNFQTKQCSCHDRPWQWRNQWGWLITHPPTKRHLPPLRMYHYFDNYKRYPENRQIDKMAALGADTLILHENWRLDAQNGGVPYDSAEFNRVVKHAHKHGIRIAPYIRGNETSAAEEYCDWFDALLRKDFDGLYMDYGGPLNEYSPADESYHAGRIHFRKHYLKMRRLRECVGKDGIFFSHTGPLFSALGMTDGIVDGYVSGEGERGVMIRDRENHQYFSGAFATNGTMWTAAFPEYSTKQMVPFLASSGQFPHAPLGVQFATSSLAHPREPGINDFYLRALWKLWGIMKDYRDFEIFNDYNCSGIFSDKFADTGAYMMLEADKKIALLLLSNFARKRQKLSTGINWRKVGFKPVSAWILTPDLDSPGLPRKIKDISELSAFVDDSGVAGFLLAGDELAGEALLHDYSTPYLAADAVELEYKKTVEQQKLLRFYPPEQAKVYLQVAVPNLAVPYEESMWWDLFENAMQLGYYDKEDNFIGIGWISRNGLVDEMPEKANYIWPGYSSPWLAIHEILPPGMHRLGIKSIHLGEPFYSFISLTLSPSHNKNDSGAYKLEFFNEIDSDRSCLKFNINMI
jgi:hypothetical protein